MDSAPKFRVVLGGIEYRPIKGPVSHLTGQTHRVGTLMPADDQKGVSGDQEPITVRSYWVIYGSNECASEFSADVSVGHDRASPTAAHGALSAKGALMVVLLTAVGVPPPAKSMPRDSTPSLVASMRRSKLPPELANEDDS